MSEAAIAAAAAACPPGGEPVEVVGAGPLADALRARFDAGPSAAGDALPAVVIETTGNPEAVRAALERVADLGTVVLAGPPQPAPAPLDLYSDVHVRGLTLVGVPAPPEGGAAAA